MTTGKVTKKHFVAHRKMIAVLCKAREVKLVSCHSPACFIQALALALALALCEGMSRGRVRHPVPRRLMEAHAIQYSTLMESITKPLGRVGVFGV
jgi:hypothetical protein